ncbi:TrbC/VirB2 family protein [Candidatus Saccharibacteria bacterium]|nr:TrbC/VirB2 family protein [Candidatus Saccharibacteria bacterium]MBR3378497.1 TrbC/VirB2 family protein [Candidatus Saccharibacteria bacterium]
MKTKIIKLTAILLCSLGLAIFIKSDNTFAKVVCDVAGSGYTSASSCFNKLKKDESTYNSIKGACDRDSSACYNAVKGYLSCPSSLSETQCNSSKKSYYNQLYSLISSGGSSNSNNNNNSGNTSTDTGTTTDDSGNEYSDAMPTELDSVDEGACTSILPKEWCTNKDSSGIQSIVSLVINVLTGGVVVAGTIGLIVCGVMWMTARDNENQVATAKRRMMEIVIGIVAWVLIYALANLFIPKTSEDIESGNIQVDSSADSDS